MAIKVLFIPNPMPSHILPLVALGKMLDKHEFTCAFLLPRQYHDYVRSFAFTVLDIDKKQEDRTTPEMIAFGRFKPQVVVDDLSYTTAFSTRFAQIPRISIVRKGILPFEDYTPGYAHSSGVIRFLAQVNKLNLKSMGMWEPEHHADLFIGNVNIIPSIPSVEVLPARLAEDTSYKYAGSLLLSDEEMLGNLKYLQMPIDGRNIQDSRKQLEDFLVRHQTLQKVYFTQGLTIPTEIQKRAATCITSLLDKNIAVITNLENEINLTDDQASRLFFSPFLPMHKICSQIDVMIHHCGSGTYNYQLAYQVPAIILGSKYYDRDDVALELENLGAARFISADLEDDVYHQIFNDASNQLLNKHSQQYQSQKEALAKLNLEAKTTQNNFHFDHIIRKLVNVA